MNTQRTVLGVYGSNTPKFIQTYAVSVGTSSTPAIAVDPARGTFSASYSWRTGLSFINPSTAVDVYICQAIDAAGNPITPTVGGPGMIPLLANGGSFIIDSPGFGAWLAIAAQPASLTVMEYIS